MARTKLSPCAYVEKGYGQVEPNHLSAQRTGQIYAQLPAAANIELLENGQFVKYDYAKGIVDFDTTDTGEWMLVFNEVKVYRDLQMDCDFAMIKDNYNARVYSPIDGNNPTKAQIVDWSSEVTAADPYEIDSIGASDNPLTNTFFTKPASMPEGTKMVPRVFKTNVGDIFTTNTIDESSVTVGQILAPASTGYLKVDNTQDMKWQVVKVYTMPDGQKGVKIMRIA